MMWLLLLLKHFQVALKAMKWSNTVTQILKEVKVVSEDFQVVVYETVQVVHPTMQHSTELLTALRVNLSQQFVHSDVCLMDMEFNMNCHTEP